MELTKTKRQKVLFERLNKLIHRIVNEPLPVNISGVWGYGSFFRGKADPRDLDVRVRFDALTPLYRDFYQAMGRAVQLEEDAETPVDAFDQTAPHGPSQHILREWASLYPTWGSLRERGYNSWRLWRYQCAGDVLRKILIKGLPKISVMVDTPEEPLRLRGTTLLIWSPDKPNFHETLAEITTGASLVEFLTNEAVNFEQQLIPVRLLATGHEAIYRAAIKLPSSPDLDALEWLVKQRKKRGIIGDEKLLENPSVKNEDLRAQFTNSVTWLQQKTEAQRTELKWLYALNTTAVVAAWAACQYAKRRSQIQKTNPCAIKKECVAAWTFHDIKSPLCGSELFYRAIKHLGLPDAFIRKLNQKKDCRPA